MIVAVPVDRRDLGLHAADSAPPRTVCAWCPDFNPHDPALAGVSHQICQVCNAKLNAQIDTREASR